MSPLSESFKPILDESLALAIGHLIVEWSQVHGFLARALAELMIGKATTLEEDPTSSAVIIGMDARPLMGLIKSLAPSRLGSEAGAEVEKIIDTMERAKTLRDFVCHCLWAENEKGKMTGHLLKTVGKITLTEKIITDKEIFEKIALLRESASQILGYMHAFGYMKTFAPSREKPY
jgi:hypothetical protein